MRVVGVVMLVLGLTGLGGSLYLSHSKALCRLEESRDALSQSEDAVKQLDRELTDLRSRREMVARGLESATARGLAGQTQRARDVLNELDAQLAQSLERLQSSREQFARQTATLEDDVRQLRLAETIIKGGYCSCALLPAALPLIIGSFLQVGSSLRPQNPVVRHPFLALFAFALLLIGVLLLPFGIRHVASGTPSDLRSLVQFLLAAVFLLGPPLASALVGVVMLVALFRPWDKDDVG